ncbi:MAG: apolipoprotein A1/A4/E family protein [Mogibacterium sp.]|nr:apolipoprotein A1/A4/E family protein [Mogibacterium sp.]MBR3330535.1 apolipoprotein A1/A4/E family protein [Mogibacterium sp.]MBR4091271.1 apolipoprotein A1/A4/E family protein [Mogibacterium sp.]
MADKKLIDKVKELLDSNANASLKDAAKKWLDEADAKYGDKFDNLKEKGGEAWDKLGEFADKYSEKAIDANEKLGKVSDKVAEKAGKFAEKAAPVVDGLKEKAAPKIDELKEKAAPKIDELKEKAAPVVSKVTELEFIKQLKAGVSSVDEVIDTFSDPEMREKMGEEAAEQIKAHAEAIKAEGKKFCDCPACTKAREILKELGVDLEEPAVEEAAEEPAAEEPAAEEPETVE